ncbi:uncharacterized protein SETTUDRAFT_109438, partial [Exserohilum turcica Et28A]
MRLINFNRLKAWLHTCLTDHVHQEPEAASSIANLRVIDCHHSGRVVVPAPTECEYVALSYVWGVQGPGNFEDADGFPPTVMDAVIATKKLGYRYLWVDRYCIDQSDENDQHNQIKQMDLIYSHAKVTIIAAAGKDPSYGLPGVSRNSFEKVYTEPLNSNWALKTELPPLFSCFITSNWFLRAWTLQEGILSKRKLCFTDYGVLFLCNSNTTGNTCLECESFKDHAKKYKQLSIPMESAMNGIIPNNILEAQTSEEKLSIIKVFLDAYSQRELTYESDSLNALLG